MPQAVPPSPLCPSAMMRFYEVAWPVPEESTAMGLTFALGLVGDPVEEE